MPRRKPDQQPDAREEVSQWEWQFTQVAEFIGSHGHCDLGQHPAADWLRQQRLSAMLGKLPLSRHERLSALGVRLDESDAHWDAMLERLRAAVPRQSATEDGPAPPLPRPVLDPYLLAWLDEQRILWAAGKLTPERRRHLLPFRPLVLSEKQNARTRHQKEDWERCFMLLVAYQQEQGHCKVPKRWLKNPELGRWVFHQRALNYKKRLNPARFRRLDALGFSWTVEKTLFPELWEQRYAEMCAFQQQHGHTRVPKAYDKKLNHWMNVQREFRRKDMLKADRIARLDAIGFEWEKAGRNGMTLDQWRDQIWEEQFRRLCAFKERFGHCHVPIEWKEDIALGSWSAAQRQKAIKHTLSPEREQRLNEIEFVWTAAYFSRRAPGPFKPAPHHKMTFQWEQNFADLTAFQREHGHLNLSATANPQLYQWRETQRRLRRAGKIDEERLARLDAIGFEWSHPDRGDVPYADWCANKWEAHFARLITYHDRFGHCNVPRHWRRMPPSPTGFLSSAG